MKHPSFCIVMILVGLAAMLAIAVISSRAAAVQQIKPEELKKRIENNDPSILVVDNQPRGVYDLGHIKGAINFPWALDIQTPGTLPRDKMLILYCDCVHAEGSIDVSDKLSTESDSCSANDDATDVANQLEVKFGYKNIRILEGGWSRWQQFGYPIEKK